MELILKFVRGKKENVGALFFFIRRKKVYDEKSKLKRRIEPFLC